MILDDGVIKVIIAGGGTGGHVFPAIAIARALEKADERIEILFVGAKGRMEMEKVPAAGFKIEGLMVTGIERKMTPSNLMVPLKAFSSLFKSAGLIRSFCPEVVIGVGGYASGPMLLAAQMRGLPTLIQEQNSYAGLTNKWLSMGANKICVAYDREPRQGRHTQPGRQT
jgi:UDP-N-acetylglucosamine--N-acetylmuramyl-(pentapeptide) pyrophosphoryl-undecaprenol N-acetylglucosamine transferase